MIRYKIEKTPDGYLITMKKGFVKLGYAIIIYQNHLEEIVMSRRNRGYGSLFIKYLIDKFNIKSLYVLETNAIAIHVYKKFGFKYTNTYNHFYFMIR